MRQTYKEPSNSLIPVQSNHKDYTQKHYQDHSYLQEVEDRTNPSREPYQTQRITQRIKKYN